jgi:hypothetical protein
MSVNKELTIAILKNEGQKVEPSLSPERGPFCTQFVVTAFNAGASKLFTTNGHTGYCGLIPRAARDKIKTSGHPNI